VRQIFIKFGTAALCKKVSRKNEFHENRVTSYFISGAGGGVNELFRFPLCDTPLSNYELREKKIVLLKVILYFMTLMKL